MILTTELKMQIQYSGIRTKPGIHCQLFRLPGLGCLVMLSALFAGLAQGAEGKVLPGHVPLAVRQLTAIGPLPATNQLRLALGVAPRDPSGLDAFLAQVADPASPNYRQFLAPTELVARFGPTEQDYEAVKAYAQSNGLSVVGTFDNRLVLDVVGPAAAVEKALQVKFHTYQHPTEARQFFAPDTEPTVRADLPVVDIQGLSDYSRPHPHLKKNAAARVLSQNGSSPDGNGCYFGNDFRNAYAAGTTLTGAGQVVGLLQFDGFYPNDIAAYARAAGGGRGSIPIQTVLLDGYNGAPASADGNTEVSLDIEMAMSMAPGLAKIVVFEAGPYGNPNDLLNSMLSYSNTINQLSCSWGWSGGPSATAETIFKYMAGAGQSFFNACGDSDAFTAGNNSVNGVDNPALDGCPASSPSITQVGGTSLTMNGTNYYREQVWNWGGGVGGSGGVSSYYPIPSWQSTISNLAGRGGSTTQRNIPDVALTADNVYVVAGGQGQGIDDIGGTSCAAPLWVGFMALVNQQATLNGRPPVGFLNPTIYSIAATANYGDCFHDVIYGNNTSPDSPNLFYAQPGYDLCTGLGTPGTSLITALAGVVALAISPTNGEDFFGPVGGPFYPASGTLQLTNAGDAAFTWSLTSLPTWLTVTPTSGSLATNGVASVVVTVSAEANNLVAAIYSANLTFQTTLGQTLALPVSLAVGQPTVINGGFETGNFKHWIQSGDKGSTLVGSDENYIHSGKYGAILGPFGGVGYLTQNLNTITNQTYLLSFWLRNPQGTPTNQFEVQWNGATIFSQTDYTNTAWTNVSIFVTATGFVTPLQFSFEDFPDFFALDDITATPVAAAVFPPATTTIQSTALSADGFQLAWGTSPGLHYQVQYKTNLLQADWINLGDAILAITNTLSLTDTNGLSDQRFYRLSVAP